MAHCLSTTTVDLPPVGKLNQGRPTGHDSQLSRSSKDDEPISEVEVPSSGLKLDPFIDLLDDDSLFLIISFCRPVIADDNAVYSHQILDGGVRNRERWWYRLIQVSRRWRRLVLDSAFRLQISLVCERGTPVAEMLAHSPPLPLIIDHIDEEYHVLTPEDEEGIKLALQHRDRVRRIRIRKSNSILKKLVIALDGEFPNLEFLSIDDHAFLRPFINYITNLNLPETFRAPNLHELVLDNFATPIESPALTTMENLVTLWLTSIPSSGYFYPDFLFQRLSLLPQLETLRIAFNCYNPGRDVEDQTSHTPVLKRFTFPSLHWLMFDGINTYLEALLPWATIPLLERLSLHLFNPIIYHIPHLRQLMETARNLRLKATTFIFREDHLHVMAYPHKGARSYTFFIELGNKHLHQQVESAARFFHPLKTVFSAVEDLTFVYDRHYASWGWNNEAGRLVWGELLGSFEKVKTLRVEDELVELVSLALEHGEGELHTELFPELQELSYPRRGVSRATSEAFTLFIDARRNAGRPVTVSYF